MVSFRCRGIKECGIYVGKTSALRWETQACPCLRIHDGARRFITPRFAGGRDFFLNSHQEFLDREKTRNTVIAQ